MRRGGAMPDSVSVEVSPDGQGWIVRVIDADGTQTVPFSLKHSAENWAEGQRIRLGLPLATTETKLDQKEE